MLVIYHGDPIVALNHPMTAGHLGTVVVGYVALDGLSPSPALLLVLFKPAAYLFRLGLKIIDCPLLFLPLTRFGCRLILLPVPVHQQPYRLLNLLGFFQKLLLRAAPLLGAVGRDLASVHRKHPFADQPFGKADGENIAKYRGDLLRHRGDELGNRGEMRAGVSGQGHEHHILLTSLGDTARADDAPGVGE